MIFYKRICYYTATRISKFSTVTSRSATVESQYSAKNSLCVRHKEIALSPWRGICTISLRFMLLLYCGPLLYPLKAAWFCRYSNSRFPFEELYPDVVLLENLKKLNAFASCRACRNPPRKRCFRLYLIPPQIQVVPYGKENIFHLFSSINTTFERMFILWQ